LVRSTLKKKEKLELWKIKTSETYMFIKNVDKNQIHYEYYPFMFRGQLFIFSSPFYIKTVTVPEFGFVAYNLLNIEHVKLGDFHE
jgi:hypothetical protein